MNATILFHRAGIAYSALCLAGVAYLIWSW